MYILKNAWRSITRSKGRNILIGIIIFVIAVSSCVALSIREAAEKAREDALADLSVTAQISVDRESMMQNAGGEGGDRSSMKEALSGMEDISLEQMQEYANSDKVKDFYYTASASLNGDDNLEAVDTTGTTSSDTTDSGVAEETADGQTQPGMMQDMQQGMAGKGDMGRMGTQGDFTITGYSSDDAMTSFADGSETITDGALFPENDGEYNCIISSELATYNSISVGDTITLENPNNEEETYTLTVSGIYENNGSSDSASSMMGGFSAAADSANRIYTSYENLQSMVATSEENATTSTDETTGMVTTTALHAQTTGTYAFANVDDYEAFKEATEESLGDGYVVSSSDITQYEQSLLPLENLSKYAGYFLLIILIIGGIILIVLNIFNIRERKYEIGVLAAIGMKKKKIGMQFLTELLIVTFMAIVLGTGIGAATSVPVANTLLSQQIESTQSANANSTQNFGRGGAPSDVGMQMEKGSGFSASTYVSEISSATDLTVIAQLIGIGILLTLIAGCVAIIFILRYDPLRILSNRD